MITSYLERGNIIMKKSIKLQDLDCANCAAKIEGVVKKIDGVTGVTVNFLNQKMELEAPDDIFDVVLSEAKKLIHKIEPDVTVKA
jgi:copper chaperone CopZ